jgi:hypothetical protein
MFEKRRYRKSSTTTKIILFSFAVLLRYLALFIVHTKLVVLKTKILQIFISNDEAHNNHHQHHYHNQARHVLYMAVKSSILFYK